MWASGERVGGHLRDMEPAAKKGREFDGWAQGLRRPLLGSAAGHVVLLAALSLLGAAAGPGAGNAVHVILVEGAQFAPSTVAAGAPPRDRSDAAASRSLSAVAANAVTPRSAAPEAAALSPFAAGAAPGDRSGGTVPPPSLRAGGDAAPAASPAGEGTRANGDGIGATGNVTAGTAVLDRSGAPGGGLREGAAGGGAADRAVRGAGTGPLLQKIRSAIVYPEEAIRRGQEGEVLLRIRVDEGGVPREIRVARSSGARTLDKAARDGVVRAAPLPSLPGWFEVPIRFSLR